MRTSAWVVLSLLVVGCSDGRVNPSDDLGTPGNDAAGMADLATDLATKGGGPMVGLSFSGCAPDFSANVIVVANNGSVAVTRSDAPLQGQVQLDLSHTSGTVQLSTAERSASGDVINVIDGTTYTNISSTMPDPIAGTLTINKYDENAGIVDLVFSGVVLENVSTHTLCTVNGTLVTSGKTF